MGHELYFTAENCKICGATATKRKSRIIHLGVKHEMVLPYILKVLARNKELTDRGESPEFPIKTEEHDESDDNNQSLVIDENPVENSRVIYSEADVGVIDENSIKVEMGEVSEEPIGDESPHCKEPENDSMKILPVLPTRTKNGATEAWITPNRDKEELIPKLVIKKPKEETWTKPQTIPPSSNSDSSNMETTADEEIDFVHPDSLGSSCLMCGATESTEHDLLTHYCSHFDTQLRDIANQGVDEEQKCRECKKMLGNNKRRLYHFGVKHLKVITLINQELKKRKDLEKQKEDSLPTNTLVDEVLEEDDDFEITYDDQPVKVDKSLDEPKRTIILKTPRDLQLTPESSPEKIENHTPIVKVGNIQSLPSIQRESLTGEDIKLVNSRTNLVPSSLILAQNSNQDSLSKSINQTEESFQCKYCDKSTKTNRLLSIHLIAVHFKKDILSKFGTQDNACEVCGKVLANVDGLAFHLGLDHDVLQIIIKNKEKNGDNSENPITSTHVNGEHSIEEEEEMEVEDEAILEEEESRLNTNITNPSECLSPSESLKCPLKCSVPLKGQADLITHFRSIHGFSNDIISKILKSRPELGFTF